MYDVSCCMIPGYSLRYHMINASIDRCTALVLITVTVSIIVLCYKVCERDSKQRSSEQGKQVHLQFGINTSTYMYGTVLSVHCTEGEREGASKTSF